MGEVWALVKSSALRREYGAIWDAHGAFYLSLLFHYGGGEPRGCCAVGSLLFTRQETEWDMTHLTILPGLLCNIGLYNTAKGDRFVTF
jgi:hypothetical protein